MVRYAIKPTVGKVYAPFDGKFALLSRRNMRLVLNPITVCLPLFTWVLEL